MSSPGHQSVRPDEGLGVYSSGIKPPEKAGSYSCEICRVAEAYVMIRKDISCNTGMAGLWVRSPL